MRTLLAPILLLAACGTFSTEEDRQLASYQEKAALYYENGNLEQAYGMTERGLAIDEGDYKLRAIRAGILWRKSGPVTQTKDPALDQCLEQFESLYDDRSLRRHEHYVLFPYAAARQKRGMRLLNESARVAAREGQQSEQAGALLAKAKTEFTAAKEMLDELLRRGEMVRDCHYHLMQIAQSLGEEALVFEHGDKFLAALKKDREQLQQRVQQTTVLAYEQELKETLRKLRGDEIATRTFLAQLHHGRRDYLKEVEHLDAVLQIDPTRTNDLYNRGRALQLLGRTEEAKDDMRKFLATTTLPPESSQVVQAVQVLAK